jgi:RNA polymerase sigma-70 factor (ECF subfamily)
MLRNISREDIGLPAEPKRRATIIVPALFDISKIKAGPVANKFFVKCGGYQLSEWVLLNGNAFTIFEIPKMIASEFSNITTGYEEEDLLALIPHMRAFARSLCRDRCLAEDLAQDALASAVKNRAGYTAGTNLKAWLFTIVRNQFYSDRRRSWRVVPLDQKMAEETLVALSNPVAALELEDVRAAMLELRDDQREALILVSVAGLPYEEAARVCNTNVGTIKSRVSRARQRLAEILAGGGPIARAAGPGRAMASLFADADRLRIGAAA